MEFKKLVMNASVEKSADISSEADAALFNSIIGSDCVLPVGAQLEASVLDNNIIRISDGMVSVGGHIGRISKGDYMDMEIESSEPGVNRNDLIVARFIAGEAGGTDMYRLVIVQGMPGIPAADPQVIKGDLYAGDPQRDYPLWRVRLEGLSIKGVDKMYTVGTMLPGKLDVSNIVNNHLTTAAGFALDARQGKVLKDYIDSRTNGKIKLWEDAEGGNIRIASPNQYERQWDIDAYNGNLRVFSWDLAKNPPVLDTNYVFKQKTKGNILTDMQLVDNAADIKVNQTPDLAAGALAVKGLYNELTVKSAITQANVTNIHASVKNLSVKAEKRDGLVDINVSFQAAANIPVYTVLFTLPTGFRPTGSEKFVQSNPVNAKTPCPIGFKTSGSVQPHDVILAGSFVIFGRTYIV